MIRTKTLLAATAALMAIAVTSNNANAMAKGQAKYTVAAPASVAAITMQQTAAPAEFVLSVQYNADQTTTAAPIETALTLKKKLSTKQYTDPGGVGIGAKALTTTLTNSFMMNNAKKTLTTAARAAPAMQNANATTSTVTSHNIILGFNSSTKLILTAAFAEIGGDTGIADVTVTMNTSKTTAKKTS